MRRTRILLTGLALGGAVLVGSTPALSAAPVAAVVEAGDDRPVDMARNDLESGRAIVLRVHHVPEPQEPHRMTLERTKAHVRRGDTGPIEVTTSRGDGSVLDRWRAPDPLTTSGEQARDEEARYAVPYSRDLAVVEITDTRTGAATAVKVEPAVRDFCAVAPTDELCRQVDLSSHASVGPQVLRTLRVGESLEVPVHVQLGNAGPDWADVSGSMFVFGILDGVGFTTADPTALPAPHFEPGSRDWTLTYSLTCLAEGDHRVFVGARFDDGSPEAVEATPADNAANTWFDVHCDPAA